MIVDSNVLRARMHIWSSGEIESAIVVFKKEQWRTGVGIFRERTTDISCRSS